MAPFEKQSHHHSCNYRFGELPTSFSPITQINFVNIGSRFSHQSILTNTDLSFKKFFLSRLSNNLWFGKILLTNTDFSFKNKMTKHLRHLFL